VLKHFDLLFRAEESPFSPSTETHKKQSPEGSRLRGFYFRLHPLMPGKRDGENTNDESVIHYCDRGIVFDEHDAVEGQKVHGACNCYWPVAV
jgi:hypothetical protein